MWVRLWHWVQWITTRLRCAFRAFEIGANTPMVDFSGFFGRHDRVSTLIIGLYLALGLCLLCGVTLAVRHVRRQNKQLAALNERVTVMAAENARLLHMVEFDDLTAARSRRYLRVLFSRSRQDGTNAMIFVDLDEFKSVNDGFGHRAGDVFLRQVAQALTGACRERETLFRHGGDEFCIYLEQVEMDVAVAHARDFVKTVSDTIVAIDGVKVRRTASAGVARIDAGQDMMGALYYADEALYAAKQAGGNLVKVTEGETLKSMIARRTGPRAEDVAEAIRKEEITYFVQPVFDTLAGHAIGVEALIRWVRADGDVLLPEKFIDVMAGNYHSNLAAPPGAATQVVNAFSAANTGVYCAFNISSRFLERSIEANLRFANKLTKGFDPSKFVFEIVESSVIRNPERTRDLLEQLRAQGIRIALDDFGTGFSNLERLQQYQVDIVKIDRRFVQGLGSARVDSGILRALYDLSCSMGFMVIAEGVETEQELAALQDIGIYNAQGYLLGRPERVSYWQNRIAKPLPPALCVKKSA